MKNNKLPKGIIVTGALIASMSLVTGCNIIDDFNPAENHELLAYGPVEMEYEYVEESTEEIKEVIGEAMLDYGVVEDYGTYENEDVETDSTEAGETDFEAYNPELDITVEVYGPPEDIGGELDKFDEATDGINIIAVYGPPEDMGRGN